MSKNDEGDKLRAWWSHQQGLDGSLAGKRAGAVLERAGWARSVGGVGPYLTLFARSGISREAADTAAASLEMHELPSARGCTYVLPASDFALGLEVGLGFGSESEMKIARKLGVTDREIDKLCAAILKALSNEDLDPAQLREQTGDASRNLGPEGKKKGLSTTLPLALGKLQSQGEIRRVPVNGRLDQQRYRYTLWKANPLAKCKLSSEEAYTELACRFFSWIGPATLAEFQQFSGLGVKLCQAAVAPLKLERVGDRNGEARLMLPKDREKFEAFRAPDKPQFVLASSLDSLSLLRTGIEALLAPQDMKRSVPGEDGAIEAGRLKGLPSHTILDRGRLIGLWEYDTASQSIAWMSFGIRDKALSAAVERMQEYVREQLGDARSFSLDSPQSRVPRIEALRRAARVN
jgi:hypothetical protein